MTAYYNEFDPKAAAWLRELIADGLIAPGEVDERSIVDVTASDLEGYTQHHFFAGIGGWSYALRLADWPDDRPLWTASLPCQPFSAAGKGLGKQDERHLLPHFISLVAQCRPTVLFGEQVSAAIKHGWLDDLYTEMEANNYAVGSVVIGAHSIGAAHIRQRLYWVADSISDDNKRTLRRINGEANGSETSNRSNVSQSGESCGASSDVCGLSNTTSERCGEARPDIVRSEKWAAGGSDGVHDSESQRRAVFHTQDIRPANGKVDSLADTSCCVTEQSPVLPTSGIDWVYCRDNKYRPVKSGIKPLADGVPRGMVHSCDPFNTQEARVVRLKGYGNAIVPTLAAEFIKAYMQCKS